MYIVVSVSYTFSILSYLRICVRVVSISVSVSGHHRSLTIPYQYILSDYVIVCSRMSFSFWIIALCCSRSFITYQPFSLPLSNCHHFGWIALCAFWKSIGLGTWIHTSFERDI